MDVSSLFMSAARLLSQLRIPWLQLLSGFPTQVVLDSPEAAYSLSSIAGVYNSSQTPGTLPWNTFNYCNAPHVNAEHYSLPADAPNASLVHLHVVLRHHKRTPDNLYPQENELNAVPWTCSDFRQLSFAGGATPVLHQTLSPPWHPFLATFWNGTCDQGQLTQAGLEDSIRHGADFWAVYSGRLGFLHTVNDRDLCIRTSTETRTFHVASGLLTGMDPASATNTFSVTTQPSAIDSIPPRYPCPKADRIRSAFQSVPAWTDHLEENADLQARLAATLGTAGMAAWSSWYDHYFDTFSSRTCHGHPLPCNSTGACVSEQDAARVFAIGDFEYDYIWSSAESAKAYTQLTFGVFLIELVDNFNQFRSAGETCKVKLYVGHDGTMIRLAASLGLGRSAPLRWPALGSEIVMETWRTSDGDHFVRVMHEGTPVPLLAWIPLDVFVEMLESQIPRNILEACTEI